MHISFRSDKLRKEFEDERALNCDRGSVQAKKIRLRVAQLEAATNLQQLRPPQPGHFHELTSDKSGWLACSLDGNYRLLFVVADNPVPALDSGGLDWSKVTQVCILGVLDYHERSKKQPV